MGVLEGDLNRSNIMTGLTSTRSIRGGLVGGETGGCGSNLSHLCA